MSNKQAAINRANNLLRLAAPSSNASMPERESAALEAAKVIDENNLTVAEKIEQKRSVRPQKPPDPDSFFTRTRPRQRPPFTQNQTGDNWSETVTEQPRKCIACGRFITAGDFAWHSSGKWRHYDITCDHFR